MNILEFISVGMFRHFLWVLFLMTCVETEATPAAPLDTDYTGVTGVSIIPPGHLFRSLLYPLSLSLSLSPPSVSVPVSFSFSVSLPILIPILILILSF